MGKEKRTFRFMQELTALNAEELFGLAKVMGVRFGDIVVLDRDGNIVVERISELRELDREELEKKDYRVKAIKKEPEDIIKEIIGVFVKSSWKEQRLLLQVLEANKEKRVLGDVSRILENQEVPSNIEGENSEGALTINARVEEDSNGASTED